ncbi:hypothetical protein HYALB_00011404 [Hymenoscyphus albidus]|uniref:Uncharacterized protein n=1 Tax=Hymenoscyphus albidus TaxID=595503 RepID=A0A9N9Q2A8_9HELO|nr:hypothetical protein HYALB_00011404 [Hymenoscyphus albidus]
MHQLSLKENGKQLCGTNILSLPRETRDLIYTYCLTSTSPIVVWSGQINYTPVQTEPPLPASDDELDSFWAAPKFITERAERIIDFHTMASSKRNIARGLLRCHPVISGEAAAIFYRMNTFSFVGYHSWYPINSWLQVIGSQNRGYLTCLEIEMHAPMHVKQKSDGARVDAPINCPWTRYEIVSQRHPRLYLPKEGPIEGIVENINPAIECFFKILGSEGLNLKVTLLTHAWFPGSQPRREEERVCPESSWFGMDLPILIEIFRRLYTMNGGGRPRIDVLWKASLLARLYAKKKREIEAPGWQIVMEHERVEDFKTVRLENYPEINYPMPHMVDITMIREGIGGEYVVAEGPYPYSDLGR